MTGPMTNRAAIDAARLLVAGRRAPHETVPGLPDVRTFDDAYAVQAAFSAEFFWATPSSAARSAAHRNSRSGSSIPAGADRWGPFSCRWVLWQQPATLSAARFFVVGVEAEFGFRLGRDLSARSAAL